MHLITQSVHLHPCSNSAMKGNNGTNRILYHDTSAQTIIEPPACFIVGTRHSRLSASLRVLQTFPDAGNRVKDDPLTISRAFPVVWCPGFVVVTPSFTHLSITFSNQRFINCSRTVDVGFVKLTSDSFIYIWEQLVSLKNGNWFQNGGPHCFRKSDESHSLTTF
jgi:hypothetical protein